MKNVWPDLKDQSQLLETIAENTTAALFMMDVNGLTTYMNATAEKMFGFKIDEIRNRSLHACIHHTRPDGTPYPMEECPIDRALPEKNQIRGHEDVFICKDGSFLNVSVAAEPIYKNGKPAGTVVEVRDITREKRDRDELEWSSKLMGMVSYAQGLFFSNQDIYDMFEEPLQQVLDLTHSEYGFIGEILQTEEGRPYLKCCFITNIGWNEATRKLWEDSRKTGFEFHKLDNLFGRVITGEEVVISNDPDHDPRAAGRPPGHPPLKAFLGIPFFKKNRMIGMIGIANRPGGYNMELVEKLQPFSDACANIIEAFRNQQELQKLTRELQISERASRIYAAKLERSNKELENFATMASHDLQAPLRKIQMFTDHLRATCEEELNESALEDIDRIQNAARRMQALVYDLLTLSRVTRKGEPFKPLSLSTVVHEVVEDLQADLESVQGQVICHELCMVEADKTQIRQLFQNLIQNSLKFHRPDVPPVVEISSTSLEGFCEIVVRDNGIGFKEEYAERIFQIFHRLHADRDYPGTGIGLTICKKIIERHGGSIQAQGAPNHGAVFTLRLPSRQSQ